MRVLPSPASARTFTWRRSQVRIRAHFLAFLIALGTITVLAAGLTSTRVIGQIVANNSSVKSGAPAAQPAPKARMVEATSALLLREKLRRSIRGMTSPSSRRETSCGARHHRSGVASASQGDIPAPLWRERRHPSGATATDAATSSQPL